MFSLVSVVLLAVVIFTNIELMLKVGCLLASGLFAIAGAIDELHIELDTGEDDK